MSYGLEIFNASGQLIYDLEYIPFTYIDRINVTTSGNKSYTIPTGRTLEATIIVTDIYSGAPHSISVLGNTVTWTVVNGPTYAIYVWSEG